MPNIDTTTIEGYENMTPEEKIAALEAFEIPNMDDFVPKADYDKMKASSERNASDAAGKKRENKTLSDRIAELERKDKIATAKDEYIKTGFSAEMALATAEAFVDGKMDIVQQNILSYASSLAEKQKDADLKQTPPPPAGGNPNPGNVNYDEEIQKALESGDYAKAAYYSRIKVQPKK